LLALLGAEVNARPARADRFVLRHSIAAPFAASMISTLLSSRGQSAGKAASDSRASPDLERVE